MIISRSTIGRILEIPRTWCLTAKISGKIFRAISLFQIIKMQSSMYSGILEILKKSLKINQKWQLLLQEISVNNKWKAKFIVKLRFKSMKKISNFWPKVSFYCWIIRKFPRTWRHFLDLLSYHVLLIQSRISGQKFYYRSRILISFIKYLVYFSWY